MNFGVHLIPNIQMDPNGNSRERVELCPMCNAPRATTAALAKWASCPTAVEGIEDKEDEEHDLGTVSFAASLRNLINMQIQKHQKPILVDPSTCYPKRGTSGAAAPIIAEGNLSVTKVVISSWVVASCSSSPELDTMLAGSHLPRISANSE